jgi:hypothetical protein
MANPLEKEIHRLKGVIPNKLETRGFTLLGWYNVCEEVLLPSWIFPLIRMVWRLDSGRTPG